MNMDRKIMILEVSPSYPGPAPNYPSTCFYTQAAKEHVAKTIHTQNVCNTYFQVTYRKMGKDNFANQILRSDFSKIASVTCSNKISTSIIVLNIVFKI